LLVVGELTLKIWLGGKVEGFRILVTLCFYHRLVDCVASCSLFANGQGRRIIDVLCGDIICVGVNERYLASLAYSVPVGGDTGSSSGYASARTSSRRCQL
jgi:hypothetical protein